MIREVSHDSVEETPEMKARWFRSLTIEERMEVFCAIMDLALGVNPKLMERKRAEPIPGRVQVLELKPGEGDLLASKAASGREIDLSDIHLLQS